MTRSDRRARGGVRWLLVGIGLLALAGVLTGSSAAVRAAAPARPAADMTTVHLPVMPAKAPSAAAAAEAPVGAAVDRSQVIWPPSEADILLASAEMPAATVPAKPLTLALDPSLIADAAKTAEKAPEGKPDAAAAPDLAACPPGVHTPPPLPLFNVEGLPGTLLVPMAYPINCESVGTTVGMPTVGYTFVRAGTKTVQEVHLSETFFRRFEIGYTMGTLDLGDFPTAVKRATTVDIGFQHVVLHNFNLSAKVVDETEYIPAVMAAATFKYNPDVMAIDRRLGGGVRALGLAHDSSTDYTLTATKTVIEPLFKRPLMLTGGIRFSEAAQLGYLGFGNAYRMTGEGSMVYMPTDWLAIAYEYRQKKNPYTRSAAGGAGGGLAGRRRGVHHRPAPDVRRRLALRRQRGQRPRR